MVLPRRPRLSKLASCFRGKSGRIPGRQIQRIWVTVENILSFSDALHAFPPIDLAGSAKQYKRRLLAIRVSSIDITTSKPPNEEAHPLPIGPLARQMKKLTRLLRMQILGVNKEITFGHVFSLSGCCRPAETQVEGILHSCC